MTSQYVTEPPTRGSVALVTSKGEMLIELWSKEAPRACRNLLTLALEGFYDDQIFHRLIPGFMIQTGDPSGTGMGGESIYGQPFAVESHSRLKFNKRGILAMASEDGMNESQFFLTLDSTPELQGKHTILGRVTGPTIYTLLDLAQCEPDPKNSERPRYPPKLLSVKVVDNPFDDLKPRSTKESRAQAEKARKEAQSQKTTTKSKAKKNTALLSFGAEEEQGATVLKGPKSSHDLLVNDKRLSRKAAPIPNQEPVNKRPKGELTAIPVEVPKVKKTEAKAESNTTEERIKALEASIRNSNSVAAPPSSEKHTSSAGRDYLAQARSKYTGAATKTDSYAALLSFQDKLRASSSSKASKRNETLSDDDEEEEAEEEEEAKEYGASDDDLDWRSHRLDAGGQPISGKDKYSVEDYEVLDPREHAAHITPIEKGKRGRDWVEDKRTYRDRQRH